MDEIFWGKVDRKGPDECWEFKGGKHPTGYGLFFVRGDKFDQMMAHRAAWIFTHGHIPEGKYICHKCDNRPCCNPNHLFVGTQKENVSDMIAKGRQRPAKGERNHSVLTEKQVLEIRRRYHPWKTTHKLLAKEFGVCKQTIATIVNGQKWKHVPFPIETHDRNNRKRKLSDELVASIKKRFEAGESIMDIATSVGVVRGTIRSALQR